MLRDPIPRSYKFLDYNEDDGRDEVPFITIKWSELDDEELSVLVSAFAFSLIQKGKKEPNNLLEFASMNVLSWHTDGADCVVCCYLMDDLISYWKYMLNNNEPESKKIHLVEKFI